MAKTGRLASFFVLVMSLLGASSPRAQEFPAEVRGQITDMLAHSALAPPPSPNATCGTVTSAEAAKWAAPWKRGFSHHPAEWPWLRQYPAGTSFRFCQYSAKVTGTTPEVAYTAEVVTLNPTANQLQAWIANACHEAIKVNSAPPAKFEQCVRELFFGYPLSAADDKKHWLGIEQFSGGQFVVAGAVIEAAARGGVVCHRDGVAVLRERPGLPSVGYFVLTEAPDGKTEKAVNDGELAECFKIASPKEWPGGSAADPAGTTREQFWSALPKLGKSPAQYGLDTRADLEPSETWRRIVRESYVASLKSTDNVMIDAWALAHAPDLLR